MKKCIALFMFLINFIPAIASADSLEGQMSYPLSGDIEVTSEYGWRVHPIWGTEIYHAGVDFAALNSLPAQVLSNWAKNTSQLQLLVSREMFFFDSFIMENMNCFEFDIDKKTRHEWSGLGENTKELKVVEKKNKKQYTDIIRYTRIK